MSTLDKISETDLRKHMVRRCSKCDLKDVCSFFNPDPDTDECVLDKKAKISLKNKEEIVKYFTELMELGRENLYNLKHKITEEGTGYDPELTKQIEAQIRILKELKSIMSTKNSIFIQAEGNAAGIFSKIFLDNKGGNKSEDQ
jgi:hypothetical protein